jgi:4-diphosphocytidyl-2-C-methyl-D-erythritol kinase
VSCPGALRSGLASEPTITLRAWAKLNLALSVGPPAPPKGYHPIASWFAPIDLHDDISITRLDAGQPSRHEISWAPDAPRPTPIDWPPEKDLAARAHRLLERESQRPLPIAMSLHKRVPVGGGLGGGSSDAAAALIGVSRVHGLGLDAQRLRALSLELGSDIAFFLDELCVQGGGDSPRAGLVTGFGESIERTISPRGNVLLFLPPFGCPTGAVYKAFDAAPTASADVDQVRRLIDAADRAAGHVDAAMLRNDLVIPACNIEPRLREIWQKLQAACGAEATVHLTGSGSTLFALTPAREAGALAARCRRAAPETVVLESAFISP